VADPVTLVAGRDNVRLEAAVTDLDASESSALLATLNAHFRDDGVQFVAPQPDRWFVHADIAPALRTRPLAAALGRTLRDLLPSGADAGRWRRWQDEIQMLLFEHPVNTAREHAGRGIVSGVWLAEGGTRPAAAATNVANVRTLAEAGIAHALAAFAGAPAQSLPVSLDAALRAGDAPAIVVAYERTPPLDTVERALAGPAWRALVAANVASVSIVSDGDGEAAVWTARRPSAWQRLLTAGRRGVGLAQLLAAVRDDADDHA